MPTKPPPPTLVISDLHLGEDVRADGSRSPTMDHVDDALRTFFDHYRQNRHGGRPWRLIINGDMVDFIAIRLLPHEVGWTSRTATEDHTYGLGFQASAAKEKLRRAMARHDGAFRALAAFVADGNELAIIVGNHDVEMVHPTVQKAFRDGLKDRAPEGVDKLALDGHVSFHPWFICDQGVMWIEHGHQYDRYCSLDSLLEPIEADREFEQNVGTAAMRYIANQLPGTPEEDNDRSFFYYISTLMGSGRETGQSLLIGYGAMASRLVKQWATRRFTPWKLAGKWQRHDSRLRELASRSQISEATLRRLFALRREPVFVELGPMLESIMLGRLALTVGAVAVIPLLFLLLPFFSALQATAAALLLTAVGHGLMAWNRELVDPRDAMERAASDIRRLTKAPLVLMGHTHYAVATALPHGGWYVNSGTWLTKPGGFRSFTHLVLRPADHSVAISVCRWHEGRSRELRTETIRLEPPKAEDWASPGVQGTTVGLAGLAP